MIFLEDLNKNSLVFIFIGLKNLEISFDKVEDIIFLDLEDFWNLEVDDNFDKVFDEVEMLIFEYFEEL